jgi:hypothetical protein
MTDGGHNSEVRVEPTPGSGRVRFGRCTIAVLVVVALGAIVGVTLWRLGGELPQATQPRPTTLAFATAGPRPGPSAERPSTTSPASADATISPGNVELPGSPELLFLQRQGEDLNLLGWRPGEPLLGVRRVVTGALRGIAEGQGYQSQLSPDGSIVLVEAPATFEASESFRAFRLESTGSQEIWSSTTLGPNVVGGFIGPKHVIVTSASQISDGRGWTIVDLSGDAAIVHELDLPAVPRPPPGTSIDFGKLTFNYVPLGISADGTAVYALSSHSSKPVFRPAYRIRIDTGQAEPITTLPITGPSRVVSSLVDPLSGRLVLAGARSAGGSGLVEAWSPGQTMPDFTAAFSNVFGALWLDDGSVLTADYDKLPGPFTFRVIKLTSAGKIDATLFTADGTNAALVGAQHGFVAAYSASRATGIRTLVVIRLEDDAISTIEVPEPSGLNGSFGLRP